MSPFLTVTNTHAKYDHIQFPGFKYILYLCLKPKWQNRLDILAHYSQLSVTEMTQIFNSFSSNIRNESARVLFIVVTQGLKVNLCPAN